MEKSEQQYNEKGDAKHYDMDRLNTLVKMERIWGTEALMHHCEITAFKYRERIGKKKDQPVQLDLTKAEWYEHAARFFYDKLQKLEGIPGTGIKKMGLPWK